MVGMERFFDYPAPLWEYFHAVDARFDDLDPADVQPARTPAHTNGLTRGQTAVRAVLWDVYGTLLNVGAGDLEQASEYTAQLTAAARVLIEEFDLMNALQTRQSDRDPAEALVERYLGLIDESHAQSRQRGIEYPEVVIEHIWQTILVECGAIKQESALQDKALRAGYLFDRAFQKTGLYTGVAQCLATLRAAGLHQGIISNAQFYTPLHMRRHFRNATKRANAELEEYFDPALMYFSYEMGLSKPNPRAFQGAAKRLADQGVQPAEILYVGNDRLNDVYGAMQMGWKAALWAVDDTQVTWRQEDPRYAETEPDAIITDPAQLTRALVG